MTQANNGAPLGICVLPEPGKNTGRTAAHPDHIHEILAHAGICCADVPFDGLAGALSGLSILVTVGEKEFPEELKTTFREWVSSGGTWISIAGVCGLSDLLGVEKEQPAPVIWNRSPYCPLGEGYLEPAGTHRTTEHIRIPLHFFNGIALRAAGARIIAGTLDAHGRETDRIGMAERPEGRGGCVVIAPDVTGSVVRIQQGVSITRDGVPAPDGTAFPNDSVLKSDDGAVLDWILDREDVPGAPGHKAFLQPIADQWKELLLRTIFDAAEARGIVLPLLWLYPRSLPALGLMSHDTDGNDPVKAARLLEVLEEAGIRSTWYVLPPGYSEEIITDIIEAGHEAAMHYDAMTEGTEWSEEAFDEQHKTLVALLGGKPVSNRDHYLRWEGDTELFHWCEKRGIRFDTSKGASKTGEAGYNFGTCHPFFPVEADGEIIDVLELPTPTQDLTVFAPAEIADPLLKAALGSHGIFHLLFHPNHIDKQPVVDALLETVRMGRGAGLEWWTAAELDEWERARRTAQWTGYRAGESFTIETESPLEQAIILWTGKSNGQPTEAVKRWGFEFNSVVVDIEPGRGYTIQTSL